MRRVLLTLATLGILCLTVGQIQAHDYHHGYGGHHGGYYGPVVVRPPVWVAPPAIVPYPVYRPAYGYGYRQYCPTPAPGFYYQGRGLSIGIGF